MNYRHQFHAGNVADVFKHLVLVRVLEALRSKATPFCVIDTHAGSGLYRLKAPGEFEQGIGRLWPVRADWPLLNDYFARLALLNDRDVCIYPGSPWLIQAALRPQDRAIFIERHPDEAAALRENLRSAGTHECRERRTRGSGQASRGTTVNEGDAWAMLKGLLPPKENRGLVFIDPPYERSDEFEQVGQALQSACARWRNGQYLVWYPIKARRPVETLQAAVRALGAEALAIEFLTLPEDMPQRLNGSGVILVNPPWKLEDWLQSILPPLAVFLAGPDGQPRTRIVNLSNRPHSEPVA